MRLAMESKLLAQRIEDFGAPEAARVRELGFEGIACEFGAAMTNWAQPEDLSSEQCRRVRAVLEDHGLGVAYSWSFFGSLVNADEQLRKQGVETARGALRVARDLGSPGVSLGSGSNNMANPWFPHPENFRPQSLGRLIRSVAELAPTAEDYGVALFLKGHTLSTLDRAEKLRVVIEAVGSPAVKAGCDPVNLTRLDTVYDSAAHTREIFATLGEHLAVASAKDYYLEDSLILRITRRPPGLGLLDYETFLNCYERRRPDGWLVIEHVDLDELVAAREYVARVAASVVPGPGNT